MTKASASSPESEPRLVDPDALRRLAADVGAEGVAALLQAFHDELTRRQAALAVALAGGDYAALAAVTHAIKGSALTFGADAVGVWASRANASARLAHPDAWDSADRVLALLDPTLAAVAELAREATP
jgi:two-component system phosphorelay protein LuxU